MKKIEIALRALLLGERIPLDVVNGNTGQILIPANRKIKAVHIRMTLREIENPIGKISIDPSPIKGTFKRVLFCYFSADKVNQKIV